MDALIARVNAGDTAAQDALFAAAYPALRELASARLVEVRDAGSPTGPSS